MITARLETIMNKTYFDKIRDTIIMNPTINAGVVLDIISRCRDWLESEHTSENDTYIKTQYEYLLKWI